MGELTKTEQTPSQLLELAIQQNLDVEKLERLMALQERWEERKAKSLYFGALSKFQSIVPALKKTKRVNFPSKQGGKVDYWYTPLPDIVEQIKGPLNECGLTYRWEIQDTEQLINVTCFITHKDGHSESTNMSAPADSSGGKNTVQQRGSTVTYLQRYTLIGALGISTADDDIDARLPLGDVITDDQIAELEELLGAVKANRSKFLEYMKVEDIKDIPANKFNSAKAALNRKKKAA